MSTIKEPIWKPLAIAFIILTIVLGAFAAIAFYQTISLNNDKTNLQSLYDHLKTTDNQNNQTITALNAKVSSLQTQLQANYTEVQSLNGQIASDNALITHLQAELQANYTQVQTLTAQITELQAKVAALQSQIAIDLQTIAQLQNELASVPQFTNLSGFVAINSMTCGGNFFGPNACTPLGLYWTNNFGSSVVYSDGSYQVYLPSSTTFSVTGIAYLLVSPGLFGSTTSLILCTGTPNSITTPPGTSTMSQNFYC